MGFTWKITINGFGPFGKGLTASLPLTKSKVSIYAGNGQGKTCLSRLFRSSENNTPLSDEFISHGLNKGSFSFEIQDDSSDPKVLKVEKNRGRDAIVKNSTGRIFHVFNSDYVRANLASRGFSPSKDIKGFILGEENIDLSAKKAELSSLLEEETKCRTQVGEAVKKAKAQLVNVGISKRQKEYVDFTIDSVLTLNAVAPSYSEALEEYEALNTLPEEIDLLGTVEFNYEQDLTSRIEMTLSTAYKRESFSEKFIDEIKLKQNFIREGMRLKSETRCPFCGQEFSEDAIALIGQYEEYLSSRQAAVQAEIEELHNSLDGLERGYSLFMASFLEKRARFESLLPAFQSHRAFVFPALPELASFTSACKDLSRSLSEKSGDITLEINHAGVGVLASMLQKAREGIEMINKEFEKLDGETARAAKALKASKQRLCREMMAKVRSEQSDSIEYRLTLLDQCKALKAEIEQDESRSKKSKKAAVSEMLARLIHSVFGDKYSFDRDNFVLLLNEEWPMPLPDEIMSDGEKSVLGFCHYIASTFELLESKSDAKDLFFVIDDPISSLDFHYVYSVAQIIRSLDALFELDRVRMLLLTHNTAFFNMLSRNEISKEHFLMREGTIEKCEAQGIVPYSAHLNDLFDIACGGKPCHTTGNSIRQVLESIMRFEEPASGRLLSYLGKKESSCLFECEYIYSLCNDQSHGASFFDREQPIDEDSIRRACVAVLKHVNHKYPNQLVAAGIDISSITNEGAGNL